MNSSVVVVPRGLGSAPRYLYVCIIVCRLLIVGECTHVPALASE